MRAAEILRGFGLFVEPAFLDVELCDRIRSEMRAADQEQAEVFHKGDPQVVRRVRRTSRASVSGSTLELLKPRFAELAPRLEEHFDLRLGAPDELQFLRYTEGDFFRPHTDNSQQTARQLSLVVFLNDQSTEPSPECHGGGDLAFYGLLGGGAAEQLGFPLASETGLVVAFRSEVLHEVRPVTHGERYTIVTWYC